MKKRPNEKYISRRLSLKEWEKESKQRRKKMAFIKGLFDLSLPGMLDKKGPSYCAGEAIKEHRRLLKSGLGNIYECRVPKEGEVFDVLQKHKNIKIERIVSSYKIPPKIYVQKHDEWVALLKGKAKLKVDGKVVELKEGDFFFIKSGKKHKVLEAEHGTFWLAIHIF